MTAKTKKPTPGIVVSLGQKLKRLFKDRLFVAFLIAGLVLGLLVLLLLGLRVRPKEFAVPLRYSTYQGFDALGAWYRVYTFGLFSLVVTIGNTILAALSFDKSRIASFFLVMGTLVVNLFTLIITWTLTGHLEV
ncbi:hypothetical protein HY346_00640 [Candidatus Microgenomates bacterium]|nr:hypothetical protein [Candidatus Microgenomates bacterium]